MAAMEQGCRIMNRLANKIALVTGAGNGLGKATAETLAAEGARVYVTDIDAAAAAAVVGGIAASGGHATALRCDVTTTQDVAAMFRAVEVAHGRLDILVNNAGLTVREDFRHMSDAQWTKIREVNLDGVIRIARDSFKLLAAAKSSSLINIASILGSRGVRPAVAYSATKGAVAALTRGLAVEYAPFGIRVNTVSPGFVKTGLTERALRSAVFEKSLTDETCLKRLGEPVEIAKAVLFFASDDSSYCTGSELVVDGGMSASL
jgi:NAD(P)-dependent dehydrogenase (short-subunit alcohol dehydrogenase family)